ncbi:DUF559 domain-containing protein [Rhodoblastus acidophilus]|uniref:DUF559 domain-containing protein n=1 Tax=Candidatus Rhodoblastus alkanivorans TaxID=2954117 RepID=A0ABS9Z9Q8_9HYPH|nr:DUF559 domain-containing protein [Candidatus Rhodoblastus alkanivorans]MCI4683362.1 DUF559 domain-containing protein [Candidatus Rhodoblastus alkanivorans]
MAQFSTDLPAVLEALREKIDDAYTTNAPFREAAAKFLDLARQTINPSVSEADVREMLIQHILTEEIFAHVFNEGDFHRENNIAKELYALEAKFFTGAVKRDTLKKLETYYAAIRANAAQISNHSEKQTFLKLIYERFYKVYNPKAADRLGVVYTPNEIVKFMIEGADWLCSKHFKKTLIDRDVEILDPATGTGTFICELLEHFRGQPDKLTHKYKEELHANEVAILPYYVANLNIEATYAAITGQFAEYPNLCFVDTLDNTTALGVKTGQHVGDLFGALSDENIERIKRQNRRKISVIIGNPPYNANQQNENDNNKNRTYRDIDERIKNSYIKASTAQKTKLYDMYARFFRWASDRLHDDGVLAFVSNSSFIDARTYDGFRKIVAEEFHEIWLVDLKGNARTSGERRRREGGNVFEDQIRVGIAISFFVKKRKASGCTIRYQAVDDYLKSDDKRVFLRERLPERRFIFVKPDAKQNWLGQTENDWADLIPVATKETKAATSKAKERALFRLFSLGVVTNRDEWVYDDNEAHLADKVSFLIDTYNANCDIIRRLSASATDLSKLNSAIKWTRAVKRDLLNGIRYVFDVNKIFVSDYRPFIRKNIYFSRNLNEMLYQIPLLFGPGAGKNVGICYVAEERANFSVFAIGNIPNKDFFMPSAAQVLARFSFSDSNTAIDNITDWGLKQFRAHYGKAATSPSPLAGEGVSLRSSETDEGFSGERGSPSSGAAAATPSSGASRHLLPQGEKGVAKRAQMLNFARKMRKEPTEAEKTLWHILRGRRFSGFKFRRQAPIGPYIADFVCFEARLIVEADGSQHAESTADAERDAWFAGQGFRVRRFWNAEILAQREVVEETLWHDLAGRTPSSGTSGNLLSRGEKESGRTRRTRPITKDAIFHYVYGVLHDPVYREKYALNLKRDFPRLPFYPDFWAWADWGERLMALHIGYESVEAWPIVRTDTPDEKARAAGVAPKPILKSDPVSGTIRLDTETTLSGIPPKAFDYRLGNRSGLDWILDQHKEKTPKDPTIREKFNTYRFADYKEKVIDLIARVTRVSVETVEIVEAMKRADR